MSKFEWTKPRPRPKHYDERPEKIVYKFPMKQEVLSSLNEKYHYYFVDGEMKWILIGNIMPET